MHWTDIDGWLTPAEGDTLRSLASGKTVLEFGTWKGRSTLAMSEVASRVVTVDHFRGDEGTGFDDTYAEAVANLQTNNPRQNVAIYRNTVAEFADANSETMGGSFDLVYVDDGHSHLSVTLSTHAALTMVRSGGILAFHDWHMATVRDAASRILIGAMRIVSMRDVARVGNLLWVPLL